jgi:hypothetical protein
VGTEGGLKSAVEWAVGANVEGSSFQPSHMRNWERERDGLVVVVLAGVVALFAEELLAALVVVRDWGPVILGAGAVALAGALVYRSWARYAATSHAGADRQAAALERQVDLLAARTAPQLSVDSWRVEGDELAIDVANVGNGPATDLTAVVDLGGLTARTRLRPDDGPGALAPDGDGRTFAVEPVFRGTVDGEEVVGVYAAAADALRAAGAERADASVALECADATGETRTRHVWESEVALGDDLAAAVESGRDAVGADGLAPA